MIKFLPILLLCASAFGQTNTVPVSEQIKQANNFRAMRQLPTKSFQLSRASQDSATVHVPPTHTIRTATDMPIEELLDRFRTNRDSLIILVREPAPVLTALPPLPKRIK